VRALGCAYRAAAHTSQTPQRASATPPATEEKAWAAGQRAQPAKPESLPPAQAPRQADIPPPTPPPNHLLFADLPRCGRAGRLKVEAGVEGGAEELPRLLSCEVPGGAGWVVRPRVRERVGAGCAPEWTRRPLQLALPPSKPSRLEARAAWAHSILETAAPAGPRARPPTGWGCSCRGSTARRARRGRRRPGRSKSARPCGCGPRAQSRSSRQLPGRRRPGAGWEGRARGGGGAEAVGAGGAGCARGPAARAPRRRRPRRRGRAPGGRAEAPSGCVRVHLQAGHAGADDDGFHGRSGAARWRARQQGQQEERAPPRRRARAAGARGHARGSCEARTPRRPAGGPRIAGATRQEASRAAPRLCVALAPKLRRRNCRSGLDCRPGALKGRRQRAAGRAQARVLPLASLRPLARRPLRCPRAGSIQAGRPWNLCGACNGMQPRRGEKVGSSLAFGPRCGTVPGPRTRRRAAPDCRREPARRPAPSDRRREC
jgi:hypothetical protein